MLEVHKVKDGSHLTIFLEGRLDTVSSPQFEDELTKSLEDVTYLELNFEKMEFISSAGLRALLYAQNIMDERGKMVLTHMDEKLKDVLEVTGFLGILTVE